MEAILIIRQMVCPNDGPRELLRIHFIRGILANHVEDGPFTPGVKVQPRIQPQHHVVNNHNYFSLRNHALHLPSRKERVPPHRGLVMQSDKLTRLMRVLKT